jgi:hypothetical protein
MKIFISSYDYESKSVSKNENMISLGKRRVKINRVREEDLPFSSQAI